MKYGITFIALGGVLAFYAAEFRGWFWILLWPATSFFLVGVSYLGLGPRIFGKQKNGTLAWYSVILLLPYFLFTWGVWHLLRIVRKEDCYNEVASGLFVGRRAFAHELPKEISMVVDLTCEFSEPQGVSDVPTYVCFPTLDASVPPDKDFIRLVDTVANFSGKIYIHCAEGHGRSGTLATAVLIARGHAADVDEALNQLTKIRPEIRLGKEQRALLERNFPS